jgi:hypothetical protein
VAADGPADTEYEVGTIITKILIKVRLEFLNRDPVERSIGLTRLKKSKNKKHPL